MRTDGHNEINSRLLQFCERASKSGMKCTGTQHSQWHCGTSNWIHRVRFMPEARILLLTTENLAVMGQTQWVFLKGDSVSNRSSPSSCMPRSRVRRQTYTHIGHLLVSGWWRTFQSWRTGLLCTWSGEGRVCFVSSANPLSVWLNRDSLLAFRLKMSRTRT